MTDKNDRSARPAREDRLAEALRRNLRRRKAQGRARRAEAGDGDDKGPPETEAGGD